MRHYREYIATLQQATCGISSIRMLQLAVCLDTVSGYSSVFVWQPNPRDADVTGHPWISSTFCRDFCRRQMSGGSVVFSTMSPAAGRVQSQLSAAISSSSSHHRTTGDAISSLTRFADSRLYEGDGSSSAWNGDPPIHKRMSTDGNDGGNRYETGARSTLPPPLTPVKLEQLSSPGPDSAAERPPSTPLDPLHCSGNYPAMLQACDLAVSGR